MLNISLRKVMLLMMSLVLVLTVVACDPGGNGGTEEGSPRREAADTEIPEPIRRAEGEEPRLAVYFHEEEEVNEMDFEEYIMGVVAGEMKPDWPREALAAQSIIARSFTLHKIEQDGGMPERNAHASTDIEEFQAYSEENVTDEVREAVKQTRGEVALYDGNFIRAWFHAFAGPQTATAEEGLGFEDENPPYIQVVDSPGMDIVPEEEKSFEETFARDEVSSAVEEVTGESIEGDLEVEELETGPSDRAVTLEIAGQEVSAPDFRLAIGSEELRSTYFEEIESGEDEVTFSGLGFGHGVGMCQWGAKALAEDGEAPEDIVTYFYEGVEINKLWD